MNEVPLFNTWNYSRITTMSACTECKQGLAKYKCPICYAKYCSVACCKSHKSKTCETVKKPEKPKRLSEDELASKAALWKGPTENEDQVPEDKLAKLYESEEVKAMLHNPHLRAILENLVNASDPSEDLEAAMQEPIFVELADQCLKVVEAEHR